MQNKSKYRRQGFSFVEVLACVVMLGLIATSMLTMYSFYQRTNALIEESTIVTMLLQAKLEDIKSRAFTKDITTSNETIDPYATYQLSASQSVNYDGNPNLKRVIVTCDWTNVFGDAKQDSVTMLVANH